MPEIRVYDFKGDEIERRDVPQGVAFADAAMEAWPEGFAGTTPLIKDATGETVAADEDAFRIMRGTDIWTIHLQPQGPAVVAGLTLTNWVLAAVSIAALVLLAPKTPNLQQNSYEWEDSDRPQFFSGQQNRVQPGRRIPDIFGTIRHFPDLITPPTIEYQGNQQKIRELYVISRGSVEISDARFFTESYDDVPSTSIEYYQPGDNWPADFPIMKPNIAVDQIELPASNEAIAFGSPMDLLANGDIFVDTEGFFDTFTDAVGTQFTMTGVLPENRGPRAVTGVSTDGKTLSTTEVFPTPETDLSGGQVGFVPLETYNIDNTTGKAKIFDIREWDKIISEINVTEYYADGAPEDIYPDSPAVSSGTLLSNTDYGESNVTLARVPPATSGPRTFKRGSKGITGTCWYVRFSGDGGSYDPDLPGTGFSTAVYTVPGVATEAWLDFQFASGLYFQAAGEPPQPRTVEIEIYYRLQGDPDEDPLPPEDGWTLVVLALSDKTRTPRRFTHKLIFPSAGKYEIYCSRRTLQNPETSTEVTVDAVSWIGLNARLESSALNDDVLNCTLADVTLNSQALSVAGNGRQFNVIASRRLYDYESEQWVVTNRVSDAIMHTLVDMGNIPRSNIDEAALFAIQAELDAQGARDGDFSAIVDQTMTVADQVQLMAAAGRITVYRRGSTFYFNRLKAGEMPVSLVNARNKTEPENRSFNLSQQNDPDAIILRYLNSENDYTESTYQYPENITPINAQEQAIIGLTDPTSVVRMAQYLWNKQKYEKDTIRISMTEEGAMLAPGDVISVTDFLSENAPIEGEIISISGTTFTFDEVILAGTYTARVRDKFGAIVIDETITISTSSATQDIPSWTGLVMPGTGATTGLLYSFAQLQYENRDNFYVVRSVPSREGVVVVEGLLYSDLTYSGDSAIAPQGEPFQKRIEDHGT